MIHTPVKVNIISFSISTYKLILDLYKSHQEFIERKEQTLFVKLSFYFYINNEIISIEDNPIFMRIDLIVNDDEDIILTNIQEIGDTFLSKYTSITGKYCTLNDEIIILTMKLQSEAL